MDGDSSVAALVGLARDGDKDAWNELVERFAPLVWSTCRRYGLSGPDAEDVGQSVWLALVDKLDDLREPAALPGWLATISRRECQHLIETRRRRDHRELHQLDGGYPDDTDVEQEILAEERDHALREAFRLLPERCRNLLELLMAEPRVPYQEISRVLDMPIGAIGPNRARCLQKLRRNLAPAAWPTGTANEVTTP